MVCDAASTCFKSMNAVVFAATDTLDNRATLLSETVAVTALAVVLAIAMLVTTAVLPDGVVYRVVLVVAAAVRASTLLTVAISYYIPSSELGFSSQRR